MRIGVNHGSLAERMLFTYGDTPEGMVESALEFIRICESLDFRNIVISMKASRVPVMLAAYRLMAQRMDQLGMDYPYIWVSQKLVMESTAGSSPQLELPPC
jgi:(E)-4-hydroxy-3-methylbut-2-enyl-diphosphate synthase